MNCREVNVGVGINMSIPTAHIVSLLYSLCCICNSLYHNIALKDIFRLQHVQNCLARVVTRSPNFSHSLPLFNKLWH